jgi:hypothetical protein
MGIDEGTVSERLAEQAGYCRVMGSPLYAALLDHAAADAARDGVVAEVVEPVAGPYGSMLGLRLMGAVHRLVLQGAAPPLARHYPSVGGDGDAAAAWPALTHLLRARTDEIRDLSGRQVQTNEVGRAAALVGGFLEVARRFALPLKVLEVGASGGLLLNWDRYRYEARGETWGPERSPVRLCSFNTPPIPPFDTIASVVSRGGCDPSPVDASTEDGRLTLQSYVWADQLHRFRLLKAALEVAHEHPVTVERARAAEWTGTRLSETKAGVATVVYHSIVEQYLSDNERRAFKTALEDAGASARDTAPIAWLRFEPDEVSSDVMLTTSFAVRLRMWPDGDELVVARAAPHGDAVTWIGWS